MKVIELFAGIGGFRLALENAGHEVIWSNEILDKPRSIYEYQFKDKPDPRDIRSIQPAEVPDGDLLCGGFPCATFSIAGKRTGFHEEDTRGSLFLKSAAFYGIKEHLFFSLRTSKDYSIMTMEKHLESSSLVWMNWGMTYNGSCLTARISESHKTEKGYLLAEVLEENVDQKYFLSAKQVERIMERTKTNKEKGRVFLQHFSNLRCSLHKRRGFKTLCGE